MSKTVPFSDYGAVQLDAQGAGMVKLGPNVGVRWNCTVASVTSTSSTNIPQCSIYIGGAATPDAFVDGTYTGNLDSTDRVSQYPVTPGQFVIAVWSGGDANAQATLTVRGTAEYGQ